jgi:hypothetical protein
VSGEPRRKPGPLRYTARKGNVTVAINTEKIMKFSSENHRVVGGKRHSKINIQVPPELTGAGEAWANARGASIETGPKIYMPANTHPHLGTFFAHIQLAVPSKIKPANETTFINTALAFWCRTAPAKMAGSQNERPPAAIQKRLFFIALLQSDHDPPPNVPTAQFRCAPVPGIRLLRSNIDPGDVGIRTGNGIYPDWGLYKL